MVKRGSRYSRKNIIGGYTPTGAAARAANAPPPATRTYANLAREYYDPNGPMQRAYREAGIVISPNNLAQHVRRLAAPSNTNLLNPPIRNNPGGPVGGRAYLPSRKNRRRNNGKKSRRTRRY